LDYDLGGARRRLLGRASAYPGMEIQGALEQIHQEGKGIVHML